VPSIIFGLALSVASTVVLARVLADFRELHTNTGRIAMGWLVVEDLFTVVALVVLPTVLAAKADLAGATIAAFMTFVRTRFLHNLPELEHFGAAGIFVDEAAIGLALATSILKDLGATGDQLDRERDRVEREFSNIKQSTTASQVSAETPVLPPQDSPAT
jgi:predicted Kef-type K+ transport protein